MSRGEEMSQIASMHNLQRTIRESVNFHAKSIDRASATSAKLQSKANWLTCALLAVAFTQLVLACAVAGYLPTWE